MASNGFVPIELLSFASTCSSETCRLRSWSQLRALRGEIGLRLLRARLLDRGEPLRVAREHGSLREVASIRSRASDDPAPSPVSRK